jgi:hypothetical protein
MLKKREEKLLEKKKKQLNKGLTEADKEIMKKVKGKKNSDKRARARETDEFDQIMDRYK